MMRQISFVGRSSGLRLWPCARGLNDLKQDMPHTMTIFPQYSEKFRTRITGSRPAVSRHLEQLVICRLYADLDILSALD